MSLRFTSDSELEVLKALWEKGPSTVRDLHESLQAGGSSWAYTTVQTLLARLEQKGYVRCDKAGRAHVFAACVSKEELLSEQLGSLADKVCAGAATPLMLTLVRERRFSRAEIQELRELLDQLEAGGRGAARANKKKRKPSAREKKDRKG